MSEECVLNEVPQAEKEIRNMTFLKYVRLDGYVLSETNDILITEVQQANKKNLPKRSRIYVAMVDSTQLDAGESDYNKINNLYMIFITSFDPFGQGKCCYRFTTKDETGMEIGDCIERIFLNTKGKDTDQISDSLRWMLRYFEETTSAVAAASGDERIMKMSEHVERIKRSGEFSLRYLSELEDRNLAVKEAREEALAEGRVEAHRENASKMKSMGFSNDVICEITGLAVEEIATLPA